MSFADEPVVLRATAVAELHDLSDAELSEKHEKYEKDVKDIESASSSDASDDDGHVLNDARDLVTHVISLEDDPTQNPWTIRAVVIGLGLSTFGGVLGEQSNLDVDFT